MKNRGMRGSLAACALLLALAAVAVHADSHAGHNCIHDSVVQGAQGHWRRAGQPDRFIPHHPNPVDGVAAPARRLQSYSNIRIAIMTDKLQDGA